METGESTFTQQYICVLVWKMSLLLNFGRRSCQLMVLNVLIALLMFCASEGGQIVVHNVLQIDISQHRCLVHIFRLWSIMSSNV